MGGTRRWCAVFPLFALLACADPVATPERTTERRGGAPPGVGSPDVLDPFAAHRRERELARIPLSQLWYRGSAIQSLDYPQDSAGVPLFEYRGTVTYHPVVIEWKAIAFLNNWDDTGDSTYLVLAERLAKRLVAEGHVRDGALYLPYQFDFDMHGLEGETILAPWYSGLAQGMALSLFVRLHRATGGERYLDHAAAIMESFTRPRGRTAGLARVDADGYFWIEEYPMTHQVKVLNGFISGLLGLHEYWQETGDERARLLLLAGTATLEDHIDAWRVPGEASLYCLHYRIQIMDYHRVHIWLLEDLARATNSSVLRAAAENFRADAY